MRISDWSSDVCSSDLRRPNALQCISSRRRAEVFNMAFLDLLLPRRKHDPAHSRAETGPRVDWSARRSEPATDRGHLAISDRPRPKSEEHTSELQSLMRNSYPPLFLKNQISRVHA